MLTLPVMLRTQRIRGPRQTKRTPLIRATAAAMTKTIQAREKAVMRQSQRSPDARLHALIDAKQSELASIIK
jgi:hypothetical protein